MTFDQKILDPPVHSAAELFPLLAEPELQALADDIRRNGQVHPIVIFAGKILDGRNRWRACQRAGVEPKLQYLDECASPTAYVLSTNLQRRHMKPAQLAVVAAEAKELFAKEAKERQGRRTDLEPNLPDDSYGMSRSDGEAIVQAAKATGAGITAAKAMDTIHREAPEVFAAVKAGTLKSVEDAKRVAALPVPEQREVIAQVRLGETSGLRALVAPKQARPVPVTQPEPDEDDEDPLGDEPEPDAVVNVEPTRPMELSPVQRALVDRPSVTIESIAPSLTRSQMIVDLRSFLESFRARVAAMPESHRAAVIPGMEDAALTFIVGFKDLLLPATAETAARTRAAFGIIQGGKS